MSDELKAENAELSEAAAVDQAGQGDEVEAHAIKIEDNGDLQQRAEYDINIACA